HSLIPHTGPQDYQPMHAISSPAHSYPLPFWPGQAEPIAARAERHGVAGACLAASFKKGL
ncbi:MAG TPA: hypothetical protein PKV55_09445, partial [Nitrospira sp.]|nr:hypothetical protein [Nitrospira sp.]